MAGGFPVGLQWNGIQSTGVGGVQVTASTTVNTVGAYGELITSTVRAATWMYVNLHDVVGANALGICGVNIATGASGSEVVQIANLVVGRASTGGNPDGGAAYLFPCAIPAGTRIAANCQSNIASEVVSVNVMLFDDAFGSVTGGGAIDTYGFNTAASSGTQIDPGGTANTKGAYSQITASTTYDLAGFFIGLDGSTTTPGAVEYFFSVDVGVGASGSEVVMLPDFPFFMIASTAPRKSVHPASSPYFPIPVPAGSRIAVRAACNGTSVNVRKFDATIYGVRA